MRSETGGLTCAASTHAHAHADDRSLSFPVAPNIAHTHTHILEECPLITHAKPDEAEIEEEAEKAIRSFSDSHKLPHSDKLLGFSATAARACELPRAARACYLNCFPQVAFSSVEK